MRAGGLALLLMGCLGCVPRVVYHCEEDRECTAMGLEGGRCEPNGFCSFADDGCASGQRFGSLATEGLGGACVGEAMTTAGDGGGADAPPSSPSSDGAGAGDGAVPADAPVSAGADAPCDLTWYLDCDGDGFAAAGATTRQACSEPAPAGCGGGWTVIPPAGASVTDCDDTRSDSRPGGTEVCFNGVDDDCDAPTLQDEAAECTIACDWSGARWLSHGWNGAAAFQTGAWFSCVAGRLSYVEWVVGAGTGVSPMASGTGDALVGCNWGSGPRWGSQGWDGGAAYTAGAHALCDGTRVTSMTWGTDNLAGPPATAGALGCNWSGAIWITNGSDGACAFQTGFAITCSQNHVTHFQFAETAGCPTVF